MFKAKKHPFVLVFWSRDPDGTQHNHGDGHLEITPGINGPTSLAARQECRRQSEANRSQALSDLGLADIRPTS